MQINIVVCDKCGERITPEDDKFIVTKRIRNKDVEKNWYWSAYKSKTIAQYHVKCYKNGGN